MSIVKKFENVEIRILSDEEEFWISGEDICKGLGYENPIGQERVIFSRNKTLLDPHSREFQNEISETRREYNEIGLYLFLMKSRTEKAEQFQTWMAQTLKELRLEKKQKQLHPEEYLLEQAKLLFGQGKQLRIHEERITTIETKLLPEAKITEEQAASINEGVRTIAYLRNRCNPPFGTVWAELKTEFGFAAYRELPIYKFSGVISWLNAMVLRYSQKPQQKKLDSYGEAP